MKCYIRRFKDGKFGIGYFKLNVCSGFNHWVFTKQEAKLFDTVAKARKTIKKYKIKNCEVEYEPKNTSKTRRRNSNFIRKIKERA